MFCPYCEHIDSRVIDSRDSYDGIRRRRECTLCGLRFTTYERVQTAALLVAKRDGRREEFSSDKLLNSIRLACAKRPLQSGSIDKVVAEIDSRIQELGKAEIPSATIGELVVRHLKKLDRVAYIRFASVYRDFADIETFREEVDSLIKTTETKQGASEDQLSLFPLDIPPQLTRRRPRRPKKQ